MSTIGSSIYDNGIFFLCNSVQWAPEYSSLNKKTYIFQSYKYVVVLLFYQSNLISMLFIILFSFQYIISACPCFRNNIYFDTNDWVLKSFQ